jgi:hypothetical protein|tara:strand:- start:234 stop:932 length:699 start_codon:yes stop_codon:yes gene_type:complete
MKTKLFIFLLSLAFLFLFSSASIVFAGGFQGALDAFKRKDYKTAYKLSLPLAEQGNTWAQYYLGVIYGSGQGVPQDKKKAFEWLLKSAKQKHPQAQSLIRARYLQQHKQAAEQGDSYAQRFLGASFYLGLGVTRDYAEAAKWYKRAAEQGDSGAQKILGAMYVRGKGIPKDFVEAYKWFSIAGESDNEKETGVDTIDNYGRLYREKIGQRKMTPDQIAEAQGLAKEWVKRSK